MARKRDPFRKKRRRRRRRRGPQRSLHLHTIQRQHTARCQIQSIPQMANLRQFSTRMSLPQSTRRDRAQIRPQQSRVQRNTHSTRRIIRLTHPTTQIERTLLKPRFQSRRTQRSRHVAHQKEHLRQ